MGFSTYYRLKVYTKDLVLKFGFRFNLSWAETEMSDLPKRSSCKSFSIAGIMNLYLANHKHPSQEHPPRRALPRQQIQIYDMQFFC